MSGTEPSIAPPPAGQENGAPLWDKDRLARPHAQPDKATRVQAMFDAIAPTYERVNTITSVGRDAVWRRETVRAADLPANGDVLDVACGTGDLLRAFAEDGRPAHVIGADFSFNMLRHAHLPDEGPEDAAVSPEHKPSAVSFCRADALRLPFADNRFDAVSCAFGIRNFQDLATGLGEFARVLKPGGKTVILEFSLPRFSPLRKLYLLYFRHLLPRIARVISRDRVGAYRYLPESVIAFTSHDQILTALAQSGFADVQARRMTLGVVTLYIAVKPKP